MTKYVKEGHAIRSHCGKLIREFHMKEKNKTAKSTTAMQAKLIFSDCHFGWLAF